MVIAEALDSCLMLIREGKVSVLDLLPLVTSDREKAKIAAILLEGINMEHFGYDRHSIEDAIVILKDAAEGMYDD